MSKEYNSNRQRLADKLKNEPIQTPIQEVRPIETPVAKRPNTKQADGTDEIHVNFWGLLRLKHYSVQSRKSIKQIILEALEAWGGRVLADSRSLSF